MATTDKLVIEFDANFQRLKGALFQLDTSVKGTLDRVGRRFDQLGRKMEQVGRNMSTQLSLPIALVGGAILKMAGDFEQGMNRVTAVSQATGAQFEALRLKAKDLGRTTQFSASEVASAMSFMAMAGLSADQILGGVTNTLKLAASAQLDMGKSADIITNILTGFGMEVSELGHAVDVLVAAFTGANTDLSQLGYAFKYAGGVAKSAGQTFEQTTASLALMGNAGFQASMAGTALRGTLNKLLHPTGDVRRAMAEIGLQVNVAGGSLVEMREIIRQLEPHVHNAAIFMRLFGQRAGPGMLGLVRQGLPAFDALMEKLKASAGLADRIAQVQMQGFNGAMRELRSAVEALAIAIGDSGVLQFFTMLAKEIADIARKMSKLNPMILAGASAFAGIVAVGGPLVLIFGKLVPLMRAAAAASLMLVNRLLLIPAAGVAAGVSIRSLVTAVQDYWGAIFDSSKDRHQAFIDGFKRQFQSSSEVIKDGVSSIFDGITSIGDETALKKELDKAQAEVKKIMDDAKVAAFDVENNAPLNIGIGLGTNVKADVERAKKALEDLQVKALQAAGKGREALQIEFERELAVYREMLSKKLISTEEFEKARVNLTTIQTKKLQELEAGRLGGMRDAMQSIASNIENALSNAFDTGKFKAGEMARAILKDLAMIAIRTSVLQPLFGGGAGGGGGALGGLLAGVFHGGGRVGAGGVRRTVSPAAFIGAPRYHNGGVAGFKPYEVPAVLKKNEVVDPGDGSVFRKVFGAPQSGGTTVQVINQSGGPVREERSRGAGGQELVKIVVGAVRDGMGRGDFDGVMRGRFGAAVQTGRR